MNRKHDLKKTALTIQMLSLLATTPMDLHAATTWTVDTCADNSVGHGQTGSLRYAVANAGDNDIIDLSSLTCGTISLQTGAVIVNEPHLYFQGPGKENLTISGALQHDRILKQVLPSFSFLGGLYLADISISGGDFYSYANAAGGCIYSYTRVSLSNVSVSHCQLKGPTYVSGGAIFAKQSFTMTSSSVTSSNATATGNAFYSGVAEGGGIFARSVSATKSTISGNTAAATHPGGMARGGGVYVGGNSDKVSIIESTISGNTASGTNGANGFGGGAMISYSVAETMISNSTITSNEATNIVGGIFVASPTISVNSSTISDNIAHAEAPPGNNVIWAAGFAANSALAPISIALQSSIIANNAQGTNSLYASDFGAIPANGNSTTVTGSNNLVRVSLAASAVLPADTDLGSCPLLGPLRDNGGPSQTRALLSNSPAIDSGNNTTNLAYDQRGFARVSGGSADMGAYELDQHDAIYSSSFEGCF